MWRSAVLMVDVLSCGFDNEGLFFVLCTHGFVLFTGEMKTKLPVTLENKLHVALNCFLIIRLQPDDKGEGSICLPTLFSRKPKEQQRRMRIWVLLQEFIFIYSRFHEYECRFPAFGEVTINNCNKCWKNPVKGSKFLCIFQTLQLATINRSPSKNKLLLFSLRWIV